MIDDAVVPAGFPRSTEDRLLLTWWLEVRSGRGLLILEVKLGLHLPGKWPNARSHRRLDGLYLPDASEDAIRRWEDVGPDRLARLVEDAPVVILESKDGLNTDVVGQAVAGLDMFSRSYPSHGTITNVVTVWAPTHPALHWVCASLGIAVYAPPRPVSQQDPT